MKICGTVLSLIILGTASLFADTTTQNKPAPVAVRMDSLELRSISSDRAVFDVRSSVTASRKLKLSRIRFSHMRLQDVPIYLAPIEQHLQLDPGKTTSLPPIPLTIYFRDLDSLAPVRQAVEEGQAKMDGNARADFDLNLVERIASRQWNATGELPVEMTMPVEVPGGFAGRAAALATLTTAQLAFDVASTAMGSLHVLQTKWEEDLRTKVAPSLVFADSRYSLKLANGERVDVVVHGMGFRTSDDAFMLTGEMLEPWKYDTDVAAALQTGEATLLDESRQLSIWPQGETQDAASARSIAGGSVQLVKLSGKNTTIDVPIDGKTVKVRMLQRDSDSNYALLRFTQSKDHGTAIALAPAQARNGTAWDRIAIFRPGEGGRTEPVFTSAHRQNGRILLDDPIDDRSFGSPLIVPEGTLGLVQDETSGTMLPQP